MQQGPIDMHFINKQEGVLQMVQAYKRSGKTQPIFGFVVYRQQIFQRQIWSERHLHLFWNTCSIFLSISNTPSAWNTTFDYVLPLGSPSFSFHSFLPYGPSTSQLPLVVWRLSQDMRANNTPILPLNK